MLTKRRRKTLTLMVQGHALRFTSGRGERAALVCGPLFVTFADLRYLQACGYLTRTGESSFCLSDKGELKALRIMADRRLRAAGEEASND